MEKGFLYKYILSNGRVYIGRDRNESDCYKRAKDHLYNALAAGYKFWPPSIYHRGESKNGFYATAADPQFMEQEWGNLIKHNTSWEDLLIGIDNNKYTQFKNKLNDGFIKQYIDSKNTIDIKQQYNTELQSVQKIIKKKKQKINKLSTTEKELLSLKEKTIYDKSNAGYIIGLPSGLKEEWYNNLFTDSKEKEAAFKSNLTQKLQIKSWQVKEFSPDDDFWKFNLNNQKETKAQEQNIITAIENITTSDSLRGVNLGEFLLIGLDISTPEGLAHSLNKDLGNFTKAFENVTSTFNSTQILNTITNTKEEATELSKQVLKNINKQNVQTILLQQIQKVIEEKSTKINTSPIQTSANIKKPDIIDLSLLLKKWFNVRKSQNYWGSTNQVEKMLEISFKYSLLIKDLFETKSIEYAYRENEDEETYLKNQIDNLQHFSK